MSKSRTRSITKKAKEIKRSDIYPTPLYEKLQDEQEELGFKNFNEYLIALLDERHETVEKIRYRRSLSRKAMGSK